MMYGINCKFFCLLNNNILLDYEKNIELNYTTDIFDKTLHYTRFTRFKFDHSYNQNDIKIDLLVFTQKRIN